MRKDHEGHHHGRPEGGRHEGRRSGEERHEGRESGRHKGEGHPGKGGMRSGHGRGRGRLFGHGDLRLVVLHLLQSGPQHGYELIKGIEALAGGDYSPSSGVIYPTLAQLEGSGMITASDAENGRRRYALSEEGQTFIAAQGEVMDEIMDRLAQAARIAKARNNPHVERAMNNLKMALQLRFRDGEPAEEILQAMAEAIDKAALEIGRIK